VRYNPVAEESQEFFSAVFASDVEEMEQGIALRRILIVPANLSIFKDSNVVLIREILHMAETHYLAFVNPRDMVVCVSVFYQEGNQLFDRVIRGDFT